MMYNSFVNPFISCKTDIISNNTVYNVMYIHYNAGAGYKTMATKAEMDLQFCMEIFLPRKYTE